MAAAAILAFSGLGVRAGPVDAAGVSPAALPTTTFYGRGYGHGIGMSQYGARGRALAGQAAREILTHYFKNATLGHRHTDTIVRVLLLTDFVGTAVKPLTIVGRSGPWTIDGIEATFPADARAIFWPTASGATTWQLRVISATGAVLHESMVTTLYQHIRPAATATLLELTSKPSAMNVYRGFLRVRLAAMAMVMNHVPLDKYLRGVVPLEMPALWPLEALKSQVIAARSYALTRLHPTTGTYDVYDDTRSQVYRGFEAENGVTNAVISGTRGAVLLSGTKIVNAMFHSADGGWTENNENVYTSPTGQIIVDPVSYLRGSSDRAPDGTSYDKTSPFATWQTKSYTGSALSAIFATDSRTNVGTLTGLDLSRRGVSGRPISVTLTGTLGPKTVSSAIFRSVFNAGKPAADPQLRSTLFDTQPIP